MTTWGLGDYPRMAARLLPAAEAVVEAAGVGPGDRVVDLACGDGNAALLAAARGAQVAGVDLEPALLARAAERAEAARADVDWREADVTATGLPSGDFDAVLSAFGVMYAPGQAAAARELARLRAPGGRVALAAWPPGSLMPAFGAAVAPFLPPPPPGDGPPSRWGDSAVLAGMLAQVGLAVTSQSDATIVVEHATATDAVAFLVATAGHVLAERAALEARGRWGELLAALHGLVAERDEGTGAPVVLALDYVVTAAG